jgi:hypothetical protein
MGDFARPCETVGTAIGDRHLESIPLEPCANDQANTGVIVHQQNTAHYGSPAVCYAFN